MKLPANSRFPQGWCLLLVLLTLSAGWSGDRPSGVADGATLADLQDQLVSGLNVRRPVDIAFISRVVTLVDQQRLPLDLVLSTFKWARPKTPRPFPYFQRALRVRAARIGVQL